MTSNYSQGIPPETMDVPPPTIPRMTTKDFFDYFPVDKHDELKARLIDNGRLLAWGGPPEKKLPLYVVPQDFREPVSDVWNTSTQEAPASGYDRIICYCECWPPVMPDDIFTLFESSTDMTLIAPAEGDDWDQWKAELADNGESIDDCDNLLFRHLVKELGEHDWIWKDRLECVNRVEDMIDHLSMVHEALMILVVPTEEGED